MNKSTRILTSTSMLLIAMAFFLNSCQHDPVGVENLEKVCFETQVLPIFQTSCAVSGCHGGGEAEGGFSATDYNSIVKHVKPGDPHGSQIYKVISNTFGEEMMPPDKPLTKEQRTLIMVWILQGAENTTCTGSNNGGDVGTGGEACDTTGTLTYNTHIASIIQSNCISCHGSTDPNGDISLTNYSEVKAMTQKLRNGVSILEGSVAHLSGFKPMPQGGTLDKCSVRKIQLWIAQGANN